MRKRERKLIVIVTLGNIVKVVGEAIKRINRLNEIDANDFVFHDEK